MRSVILGPGETIVKEKELARLGTLAEAHSDYLDAIRDMAVKQRHALDMREEHPLDTYWIGYCRAIKDFGLAVVSAQAERLDRSA